MEPPLNGEAPRAGRPARHFGLALAALLGLATLLALPGRARAHTPLLSQSQFSWDAPGTVHGELVFAWQDAVTLTKAQALRGHADAGRAPGFDAVITEGVVVTADGARCPGRLEHAGPVEGDGFLFIATFSCAARPARLAVALPFVGALPDGHRHLLRLAAGLAATETTLFGEQRTLELTLPRTDAAPSAPPARSTWHAVLAAVPLGVTHILTGWDHLLFLLGLALGAPGLRALVLPVTAFTAAHSLTLGLAALSVFAPSPRLVEPLIALSISLVAFDNLRREAPRARSAVTFAFGLVHGFGFASALHELTLAEDRLLPTLFGFNSGVEIGQLAAVAAASLATSLLGLLPDPRQKRAFAALNAVVGVLGLSLLGARVLGR